MKSSAKDKRNMLITFRGREGSLMSSYLSHGKQDAQLRWGLEFDLQRPKHDQ